jgi:hypothetical protein
LRHPYVTTVTLGLLAFAAGCDHDFFAPESRVDRNPDCRMPFTEYSAGDSVAGLDLDARVANCGTRPSVTYIYGTCHATSETGCAPPLEVQSWSFRDRKPSRAPAGHDVEVRRGNVTVVIFARSDRLASLAERSLRPGSPQD